MALFSAVTLVRTIILVTIPICLSAQMASKPNSATVKIDTVNEMGAPTLGWLESFTDASTKRNLTSRFQGLEGSDIPYGAYNYIVHQGPPGASPASVSGRVVVQQPEVLVVAVVPSVVWTDITIGNRPGFVIEGRIEPPPKQEVGALVRMRLSPIDGSPDLDVHVDQSGRFRLYSPLSGRYVLSIVRGFELLAVQVISFDSGMRPAPLTIRLPDKPPTVNRIHPIGR